MELRSKTKAQQRNEFRELECILSALGFYEIGMELEEMRELVNALEVSMWQNEAATLEREELVVFKQNEVHNSTMCSPSAAVTHKRKSVPTNNGFSNGSASSPFSSPEVPSQQLTIQAEVYHSHDWSPTSTIPPPPPAPPTSPCCGMQQKPYAVDALELKRLQLKRQMFVADEDGIIEIIDAKRPCVKADTTFTCVSSDSSDSGANMSNGVASSDFSQDYNTSFIDDSNDADWLP